MPKNVRSVIKKIVVIANMALVVIFILGSCSAYLNPAKYWYVAIVGVGMPLIVLALLLFTFFWAILKSKWAFFSIAILLFGWGQVRAIFAFHPFSSFNIKKQPHTLRVMQWNVARFDQMHPDRPGGSYRKKILNYIKEQQTDVICIQEFLESGDKRNMAANIPYFTKELGFPYHYYVRDYQRGDGLYELGIAIFSKYPITDTARIKYDGPDSLKAAESLIRADINVDGQPISIFTTHLQSLLMSGDDYFVIKRLVKVEGTAVKQSVGVAKKFKKAYMFRSNQAEVLRRELDASPHPEILCSDFNDVPNSFTYFKVQGDRTDAFLQKGFGIGRTFASLSPTLRIDFILSNQKLAVTQFKKTKKPWSDHYPLVADFLLPSKNE
jgi:endonuclease/exonuclease/phosphatase family metal-dependent hydrolase